MEKIKPISDGDHDGIIEMKDFSFSARETRLTAVMYAALLKSYDGLDKGLAPLEKLVTSISDHEGILTVWWNISEPPEYYKSIFGEAWEYVREDSSNVEHECPPQLAF